MFFTESQFFSLPPVGQGSVYFGQALSDAITTCIFCPAPRGDFSMSILVGQTKMGMHASKATTQQNTTLNNTLIAL